jgi:prepilin-type N-terminal cleavage/methylation domain-containing protein
MHLSTWLRRAAADEQGFSLTELLVAMSVGVVVLFASMQIFINGVQGTARVTDRVEVTQRARLAMDRVTTLLNAQVCVSTTVPPVITGSTATTASFYADLNGASGTPRRYDVIYDATADTLTERSYPVTIAADGTLTLGAASTRVIGTNIQPVNAGTPIFNYLAFKGDGTVDPADATATGSVVAVPVAVNKIASVVRIDAAFGAWADRTNHADARAAVFTGTGTVASADATAVADSSNTTLTAANGTNCQ